MCDGVTIPLKEDFEIYRSYVSYCVVVEFLRVGNRVRAWVRVYVLI